MKLYNPLYIENDHVCVWMFICINKTLCGKGINTENMVLGYLLIHNPFLVVKW